MWTARKISFAHLFAYFANYYQPEPNAKHKQILIAERESINLNNHIAIWICYSIHIQIFIAVVDERLWEFMENFFETIEKMFFGNFQI